MNNHRRLATLTFCFLFCIFGTHPALASHDNGRGSSNDSEEEEGGSGSVDVNVDVDVDPRITVTDRSRTDNSSESMSRSNSNSRSASKSNSSVGTVKAITGDAIATNGDVAGSVTNDLVIEAVDLDSTADAIVKAAELDLRKAAPAPRSQPGSSNPNDSPCGDGTGLSVQTGPAGGGVSSILEACRAHRVKMQNDSDPDSWRTTMVNTQYYVGFPFRLVVHVVSGGILH